MPTIIVASTNPVKIRAALDGFQRMFPDQTFTAEGVAAVSGVSDQPMTDAETRQGAYNRVKNARETHPAADFWIGLEGGIDHNANGGMVSFAWVVVSDGACTGESRTASFPLPEETVRLIREGMELGDADDVVFGRVNSKQQNGSVGLLTGDALDRAALYEHAVVLALIPFKNAGLTFK